MTKIRFGPVIHSSDAAEAVGQATFSEKLGLDSFWIPEYLTLPYFDPFVLAGAVAQATTTIQIGTGVALAAFRSPALLAKAASSVDQLSNGRFILGLGIGGTEADFRVAGVDFASRGRLVDETVEATHQLLAGGPTHFEGEYFQLEGLELSPPSIQRRVPLWSGANGAAGLARGPLRRAARHADGFFPFLTSVAEYRRGQAVIRELAAEAGRNPDDLAWGLHIWTCLGESELDAAASVERALHEKYAAAGKWVVESSLGYLLGTPGDMVALIEQYVALGVSHFAIDPACPENRILELLETMAREVAPRFRD